MSEKQKKFLETINRVMPVMSELEQEKLLAFGEGLAFMCGVNDRSSEERESA